MTANQINYAKLQEDIRHNKATEGENYRHNVEDEKIRSDTNAVSRETLEVTASHYARQDAINEEHYGRMDAETARNHVAMEFETHRSNIADESERTRSNQAQESIKQQQTEEEVRHNKAVEKETTRHNKAEEKIGTTQAKAAESQAKSAAKNADTRYREYIVNKYYTEKQVAYNNAVIFLDQVKLDESVRHNVAQEQETTRHNTEMEAVEWNKSQYAFISTPTSDTETAKVKAVTATEKAKATEMLARAGLLRTEESWYAWNQIVDSAVDITQAVKNFSNAIPGLGIATK